MGLGIIFMLWDYKRQSHKNMRKADYMLRSGKNVENTTPNMLGYHNQSMARQAMPATQVLYQELQSEKIVVPPSKEQNFRKYFEIRKKYGFDQV